MYYVHATAALVKLHSSYVNLIHHSLVANDNIQILVIFFRLSYRCFECLQVPRENRYSQPNFLVLRGDKCSPRFFEVEVVRVNSKSPLPNHAYQ